MICYVGIASPHKQPHAWHKHPVASVPPTTILLNPVVASNCAGNLWWPAFCKATHPLYLPGEPVCSFHRCAEDWSKKHFLLLTRQNVLSSTTYTFLSVNPTHTHNQFQSRQYAKHRKKKLKLKKKKKKNDLNQPDLARQQIGAKDYGGSHTLGILWRLLLPVSCLLSLSLALSHSPGLNFDLVFVNTWRQQLKKWPFLIGLNLDSTVTIPLLF